MLGGRAQLSRGFADLVNLSRTGTLIRTTYALRTGSEWPLTIRLTGKAISVTGRVVRCEPVDVQLPGGAALRHQFSVAFTFVGISAEADEVLTHVCGDEMETGG